MTRERPSLTSFSIERELSGRLDELCSRMAKGLDIGLDMKGQRLSRSAVGRTILYWFLDEHGVHMTPVEIEDEAPKKEKKKKKKKNKKKKKAADE